MVTVPGIEKGETGEENLRHPAIVYSKGVPKTASVV
jgi:hypothetical protein